MEYSNDAKQHISDSPVVIAKREHIRTPAGEKTLLHLNICPHCLKKTRRGRELLRYLAEHEVRPRGIVERLAQIVRACKPILARFVPAGPF
jgi:hypothetical protein